MSVPQSSYQARTKLPSTRSAVLKFLTIQPASFGEIAEYAMEFSCQSPAGTVSSYRHIGPAFAHMVLEGLVEPVNSKDDTWAITSKGRMALHVAEHATEKGA